MAAMFLNGLGEMFQARCVMRPQSSPLRCPMEPLVRQLLISRVARPHAVVGVNVAEREVEVLKRARENFVRKRREMAEQMIPTGAAAAHFAPSFVALQAAIEAIDRAIKDEVALPADYASSAPEQEEVSGAARSSNVVDVDFDSA